MADEEPLIRYAAQNGEVELVLGLLVQRVEYQGGHIGA